MLHCADALGLSKDDFIKTTVSSWYNDLRLQTKFQTSEKEEFDVLMYLYLISNHIVPRFVGCVVPGCQTDEILLSRLKSLHVGDIT